MATPGPWAVRQLSLDTTSVFPEDRNSNDGCAIGQFFGPDKKANAQLAIASHDMRAALQNIAGVLRTDLETHLGEKIAKQIRAALAKAEV